MTYLRIRLNKTRPVPNPTLADNEVQIGEFIVRWNNGYWKLWNWHDNCYQIGAFSTKAEAVEVARLGC